MLMKLIPGLRKSVTDCDEKRHREKKRESHREACDVFSARDETEDKRKM